MKLIRIVTKASRDVRDFFAEERVSWAPFVGAARGYDLATFAQDSRAAVSVTLLSLAQAIAFAAIAGLPVVYGILCAAVAALVAPFFAGSRHTILGPTNATAFMLFSFFAVNPTLSGRSGELMPLLVLMVGLLAVAGALFRVADLLQYISRSVLVGYISGAAVLIIVNQLVPFLGVAEHVDGDSSSTFAGLLFGVLQVVHLTEIGPVLIGFVTLGIYAFLRRWRPAWPAFALTLIISSVVFGSMIRMNIAPFASVDTFATFGFGDLLPRSPNFIRPGIFADISALLGVALAIAFLASLENTLMAKTLASKTGERADVNQDMLSVGMANLASSFAGGMPASGSLTRSMLNYDSGARTQFSSVFTGLYTTAAALLIAASAGWGFPMMDFVPKAALAAVVIALSLSLFNLRNIRICLRSTGDDAGVLIVTFLATLLAPLHVAIFIGVAMSITLFLRKASRPFLIEYEFNEAGELREMGEKRKRPIPSISIVHVEGDLFSARPSFSGPKSSGLYPILRSR